MAEDYGQLVPWEHLRTEPEHVTSTQHPHNQHIVSNQLFASRESLKAWWIFVGAIATNKYRNIKQCPPIFWQLQSNFRKMCAPTLTCHTDCALSPAFQLPLVSSPSFLPDHHAALCWLNHPEVILCGWLDVKIQELINPQVQFLTVFFGLTDMGYITLHAKLRQAVVVSNWSWFNTTLNQSYRLNQNTAQLIMVKWLSESKFHV